MRRATVQSLAVALVLATALFAVSVSVAVAAPQLGLQMTRTFTPDRIGDERLAYDITVKNTASSNPSPGEQLTCHGTPEDGVSWLGHDPSPEFEISWLRNGTLIPGTRGPAATSKSYVVSAEDAGKTLQCMVYGKSDPDGAGSTYAPIAAATVSLPPLAVTPAPPSAPSGSSTPTNKGPILATPQGTATTTAGSNMLTSVVTAEGTGNLTAGSKVIEGLNTTTGAFTHHQAITGSGIPPETTIFQVFAGKIELSQAVTETKVGATLKAGANPFGKGQTIEGEGIPSGTTILASTATGSGPGSVGQKIEMSNNAETSATNVAISGTAEETCEAPADWTGSGLSWSYQWLRNGQPIPGATSAIYTVQSGDTTPPSRIQCEVIVEADDTKAIAIETETPPTEPLAPAPYQFPNSGPPPSIGGVSNETSGLVTLEVELPGGEETFAFKAISDNTVWKCVTSPPGPGVNARAVCTTADVLAPQASFPPVEVVAALGRQAPELLTVRSRVSGGGSVEPLVQEDSVLLAPALPFGFKSFETRTLDEDEADYGQAGGHPVSAAASFALNTHTRVEKVASVGLEAVVGTTRVIDTDVPRGFAGNLQGVTQRCQSVLDVVAVKSACPLGSVVGEIKIALEIGTTNSPIYLMESEDGALPQFAFHVNEFVYTLTPELRSDDHYSIRLASGPIAKEATPFSVTATLCSFGGKVSVNESGGFEVDGCRKSGEPGANVIPFLTNPTRCVGGAPTTTISMDSWEHPGEWASASFASPALTGCEDVKFEPNMSLVPTSDRADAPTGLDVELSMPTEGLVTPDGIAQANLADSKVVLPEGMTVNPAAANGLGACSSAQMALGTNDKPACPESSKVGTAEIETPLLEEHLHGVVYVAKQEDNPFKSLLALYLVVESEHYGLTVKIPGQISLDPTTGRLTATFNEAPEVPFSHLILHLTSGNHAALVNPPRCGTYTFSTQLTPWTVSDPSSPTPAVSVNGTVPFKIEHGPDGGACPAGGLQAKLAAGMGSTQAGGTGPFVLDLSREDGSARINALEIAMPPGLSGYLKGIPHCSDATLAGISTAEGTGASELANPSCPSSSLLGSVAVKVGAGVYPFYLNTAKAYLAGPYKGAPFSIAVVAPAVAGPFDLGTVVVRNALYIDPHTAQVKVISDPIPTVWHGIPLDLRELTVNIDRPNFILAPTSCEPATIGVRIGSEDGQTATLQNRFQVGGCEKLGFKPLFTASTSGKTSRKNGASLHVKLAYYPGQANIQTVKVQLPKVLPSRLTTLQKACTEQAFNTNPATCPAGSIVGYAKASTPLLDNPLQGPAYFVSHGSAKFPELIIVLQGEGVTVELAGETFINKAGVTSATFNHLPDAPVNTFELTLPQGPNSALSANKDLCTTTPTMATTFNAQNAATIEQNTPIEVENCPYTLQILTHTTRNHTLTLNVLVPAAGKLTATGKDLTTTTKITNHRTTLTLKLKQRHTGPLHTSAVLRFTPTNGKQRNILRKTLNVSLR